MPAIPCKMDEIPFYINKLRGKSAPYKAWHTAGLNEGVQHKLEARTVVLKPLIQWTYMGHVKKISLVPSLRNSDVIGLWYGRGSVYLEVHWGFCCTVKI